MLDIKCHIDIVIVDFYIAKKYVFINERWTAKNLQNN